LKEEIARREKAAAGDADERRTAGESARRRLERTAPLRASAEAMCRQAEELATRSAQLAHVSGGERTW
jgi:hypothetical protein